MGVKRRYIFIFALFNVAVVGGGGRAARPTGTAVNGNDMKIDFHGAAKTLLAKPEDIEYHEKVGNRKERMKQ